MNLEQLNLVYLPQEDRLLFRIGFSAPNDNASKQEVKMLLTRRLVQRLWPTLIDALQMQMRIDRPEASFASEDLVKLQHQESVQTFAQEGHFEKVYDEVERTSALGEAPQLIDAIHFRLNPQQAFHMQLVTEKGNNIDLKMPTDMVHGFSKLLQDATKKAEWQLDLNMLEEEDGPSEKRLLN